MCNLRNPFSNFEMTPGLKLSTHTLFFINHYLGKDSALRVTISPVSLKFCNELRHGYRIKRKGIKQEFCLLTYTRCNREVIALFNYSDWNTDGDLRTNRPLLRLFHPQAAGLKIAQLLTT